MRVRWIGLVCAVVVLAVVAAAVGYEVGQRRLPTATTYTTARPVAAVSPSIPVDQVAPYDPDIDYPTLDTGLKYRHRVLGDRDYRWRYDVPVGWASEPLPFAEIRWRPEGEPLSGGYSMRVKIVNAHLTNEQMVDQKREAVESTYDDVRVTAQSDDMLSFRYRDPTTNRQRFNTFRWFTPTGGVTAEFEMSVVGRKQDVDGLEDLFGQVGASVTKLS